MIYHGPRLPRRKYPITLSKSLSGGGSEISMSRWKFFAIWNLKIHSITSTLVAFSSNLTRKLCNDINYRTMNQAVGYSFSRFRLIFTVIRSQMLGVVRSHRRSDQILCSFQPCFEHCVLSAHLCTSSEAAYQQALKGWSHNFGLTDTHW